MEINTKYFYFKINEWHHLYTGIILVILSYCYKSVLLWTVGWILIADDLGQHIMQGSLGKNYHSPFHYFGKPLYMLRKWLIKKFPNLDWLNKW